MTRDANGFAGLLVIQLRYRGARSLKDKRAHVRSIRDRLQRAGFSTSEVSGHGSWTSGQLAISVVARSASDAEKRLDEAVSTSAVTGAEIHVVQRVVVGLDDADEL